MNITILFVLIGLAVGLVAVILRRGARSEALGDIAVGVLGALIGGFLFRFVSADGESLRGSMAAAATGAALLVIDLRLLRRSFAERLIRRVVWRRFTPISRSAPLLSRQPEEDSGICPVCGQKHLF
jgi:uncharacterized membrane protein YeaQ/YmgE (transglycosylase-associated protein family)